MKYWFKLGKKRDPIECILAVRALAIQKRGSHRSLMKISFSGRGGVPMTSG